jgi:hypothetical protein
MERLPRRKGVILFSNLTRILTEGEQPDTEFIYLILANIPSLENSQVYIHRNDILTGDFSEFTDGVELEFAPEVVPQEKYQAAIDAGKPIRPYVGRDVLLAKNVQKEVGKEPASTSLKVVPAEAEKPKKETKKVKRIKIVPEGDSTIRAGQSSFHQKDIQTFGEDGKLAPLDVRISSANKFTLVDLSTRKTLESGNLKANNVNFFKWITPTDGIESIGIKFSGVREIRLSLVELSSGDTLEFTLAKV